MKPVLCLAGLETLVHTNTVCSQVSITKKVHFCKLLKVAFYASTVVGGIMSTWTQ